MIDVKTLKKSVRGRRILVDSDIIIYLTEMTEPYHHLSRELFAMIEGGNASASGELILFFSWRFENVRPTSCHFLP